MPSWVCVDWTDEIRPYDVEQTDHRRSARNGHGGVALWRSRVGAAKVPSSTFSANRFS